MSKRDFFQIFCMFYLQCITRKCAKEKKQQYLMLYQTWKRTSVYFKLALSWSYIFLSLLLNHLSDRSILIDSKCRGGSQSGRSLNSSWPTSTLHQNLVMWTVNHKVGVNEQCSNMENIKVYLIHKCIAGCNETLVITDNNNWNSTVLS